jgi:opacity protein-like surface antigen
LAPEPFHDRGHRLWRSGIRLRREYLALEPRYGVHGHARGADWQLGLHRRPPLRRSLERDVLPFGRRFDGSTLDVSTTAFSGYAVYRTYESEKAILDAGVGFRAFDVDLDLDLESADSRPDYSASESATWAVPLVAARVILPLNESWFATAFADGGMTSSDTSTWQVFASVGYRFNPRWSTQVGWRYMDIQKDIGGLDTTLDLSGPLIGVSARF